MVDPTATPSLQSIFNVTCYGSWDFSIKTIAAEQRAYHIHLVENISERFTTNWETVFKNNFIKCDAVIENDTASDIIAADYFGDIITSVKNSRDYWPIII